MECIEYIGFGFYVFTALYLMLGASFAWYGVKSGHMGILISAVSVFIWPIFMIIAFVLMGIEDEQQNKNS